MLIRPYRETDLDALVAVNDEAFPAVPITPRDALAALVGMSSVRLVVDDGEVGGFVLAMPPGLDYSSENYRWFSARSQDWLYVDRIVLAPRLQGQGIGPRLYDAVLAAARDAGYREVTCEVNLRPPNPGSLAFHTRLGFREVGRQETNGGDYEVALLAVPVTEGIG